MLIRKPVAEVFEAIVNPATTSKFWFTKGSGRMEKGKQVQWDWEMYGVSAQAKVIELEENKRIAWQTRGPGAVGKHFGGRIWRYELQPVEGGTLVSETWDISEESAVTKPVVRQAAKKTAENMTATLDRIADRLA
jgi:uncharacterized protein YndB with AHSA1/START domain